MADHLYRFTNPVSFTQGLLARRNFATTSSLDRGLSGSPRATAMWRSGSARRADGNERQQARRRRRQRGERDAVGNELGHCGVRDSLGGELLKPAVPVEQHDPDYLLCGEPGSARPGLFVGETRRLAHGLDLGHAIAQEVQHQMQHRRLPKRLQDKANPGSEPR